MIINHNMNALNAHRSMVGNTGAAGKSMEKLSSGLRINRAGDDAAGLAISEKMRGQIRGLDQASRNAQDGISMIQTAEGALTETHSILQRMRELSVQSANDTNNTADRGQIQKEIEQLKSEINRISDTTEFNTKKLLNGDSDVKAEVGKDIKDLIKVTGASDKTKVGTKLAITEVTKATAASNTVELVPTKATTITINGTTVDLGTLGDDAAVQAMQAKDINNAMKEAGITGVTASYDGTTKKITFTSDEVGSDAKLDIETTGGTLGTPTEGKDATVKITGIDASNIEAKGNTIKIKSGTEGAEGLQIDVLKTGTAATDNTVKVTSVGMNLQIGANEGQNIALSIGNMGSKALGVDTIDVTEADKADKAVTTIQKAIDTVSSERSKLGAYQNRLEHTINNLGASSENLTAAESRVRDVDMAKEMMTFSKNNILQQAAQAMLAQANQQPQGVLQLLR